MQKIVKLVLSLGSERKERAAGEILKKIRLAKTNEVIEQTVIGNNDHDV
jgi:hypothetical protein